MATVIYVPKDPSAQKAAGAGSAVGRGVSSFIQALMGTKMEEKRRAEDFQRKMQMMRTEYGLKKDIEMERTRLSGMGGPKTIDQAILRSYGQTQRLAQALSQAQPGEDMKKVAEAFKQVTDAHKGLLGLKERMAKAAASGREEAQWEERRKHGPAAVGAEETARQTAQKPFDVAMEGIRQTHRKEMAEYNKVIQESLIEYRDTLMKDRTLTEEQRTMRRMLTNVLLKTKFKARDLPAVEDLVNTLLKSVNLKGIELSPGARGLADFIRRGAGVPQMGEGGWQDIQP